MQLPSQFISAKPVKTDSYPTIDILSSSKDTEADDIQLSQGRSTSQVIN
jgi:hypothetical protein